MFLYNNIFISAQQQKKAECKRERDRETERQRDRERPCSKVVLKTITG